MSTEVSAGEQPGVRKDALNHETWRWALTIGLTGALIEGAVHIELQWFGVPDNSWYRIIWLASVVNAALLLSVGLILSSVIDVLVRDRGVVSVLARQFERHHESARGLIWRVLPVVTLATAAAVVVIEGGSWVTGRVSTSRLAAASPATPRAEESATAASRWDSGSEASDQSLGQVRMARGLG